MPDPSASAASADGWLLELGLLILHADRRGWYLMVICLLLYRLLLGWRRGLSRYNGDPAIDAKPSRRYRLAMAVRAYREILFVR